MLASATVEWGPASDRELGILGLGRGDSFAYFCLFMLLLLGAFGILALLDAGIEWVLGKGWAGKGDNDDSKEGK